MSALEVLQSCPMQHKALLSAIHGVDPSDLSLIYFDSENCEPRLPPSVTFMLTIGCLGKNIFLTILDEGAATCIMSLSCWQALGSPTLVLSLIVSKEFDRHVFKPHGILTTLPIEIGGKTISIDTEVIDAPLDYNLLLGCTWFYAMKAIASTIFRLLRFPHQGKIVTINQLDYCTPNLCPNANSTMPLISEYESVAQSIGVGMFKDPCLMGVFPLSPPHIPNMDPINMISSSGSYDSRITPSPISSSLPVSQYPIPLPSPSHD
jgi:hypothetical protein